jgi:ABC-type sugar transport system ATPase subunit
MVFQRYVRFPHLDVFENVAFGLKVKGTPRLESASGSSTCCISFSSTASQTVPSTN